MNDRIILDASKEIALREKAFTWFFAAMDENKTGEKEDWCRTVLKAILTPETSNETQKTESFRNIVAKCYNSCEKKPNSLIASYIKDGKNEEIKELFTNSVIVWSPSQLFTIS